MKYSFLTLFPELIESYFQSSILQKAVKKGLISIETINIRNFSKNKHQKIDGPLIGGGAGLLMQANILVEAVNAMATPQCKVIFLTPCAKPFIQNDARRLCKIEHIVFVCGRYEGFDERSIEICALELYSVGDFILTGGELGALCLADSIARQIKGVLGNKQSLQHESFENNLLEAPNFTKPISLQNGCSNRQHTVPSEFLKGNHNKISALKISMAHSKTKFYRPDLLKNGNEK